MTTGQTMTDNIMAKRKMTTDTNNDRQTMTHNTMAKGQQDKQWLKDNRQ